MYKSIQIIYGCACLAAVPIISACCSQFWHRSKDFQLFLIVFLCEKCPRVLVRLDRYAFCLFLAMGYQAYLLSRVCCRNLWNVWSKKSLTPQLLVSVFMELIYHIPAQIEKIFFCNWDAGSILQSQQQLFWQGHSSLLKVTDCMLQFYYTIHAWLPS